MKMNITNYYNRLRIWFSSLTPKQIKMGVGVLAVLIIAFVGYLFFRPNIYSSTHMRIQITLPRDWIYKDELIPHRRVRFSPAESLGSATDPGLTLREFALKDYPDFTGGFNLVEFMNYLIPQYQGVDYVADFEYEQFLFANVEAYRLQYRGTEGEIKPQYMDIYYFLDDRGFKLTYTAADINFEQYRGLINGILDSVVLN